MHLSGTLKIWIMVAHSPGWPRSTVIVEEAKRPMHVFENFYRSFNSLGCVSNSVPNMNSCDIKVRNLKLSGTQLNSPQLTVWGINLTLLVHIFTKLSVGSVKTTSSFLHYFFNTIINQAFSTSLRMYELRLIPTNRQPNKQIFPMLCTMFSFERTRTTNNLTFWWHCS